MTKKSGSRRRWWLVPILAVLVAGATTSAFARSQPVVPRPTTVRIDPRGLGLRLYRRLGGRRLEQALMVRFIREGFAVASWAAGGDVRLRIRETADGLRLEAQGPAGRRTRDVRLRPEPLPGLYLELAHKSIQLVHAALRTTEGPVAPTRPEGKSASVDEPPASASVARPPLPPVAMVAPAPTPVATRKPTLAVTSDR